MHAEPQDGNFPFKVGRDVRHTCLCSPCKMGFVTKRTFTLFSDPRELDSTLAEITLIMARCSLFERFVNYYVLNDLEQLKAARRADGKAGAIIHVRLYQVLKITFTSSGSPDATAFLPELDKDVLQQVTRGSSMMQQFFILSSQYITLEEAFMQKSIEKVFVGHLHSSVGATLQYQFVLTIFLGNTA